MFRNKRSPCNEEPAPQPKSNPHTLQLEKVGAARKTQHSQIYVITFLSCCKEGSIVVASSLTLCDPTNWSPPGASVHGLSRQEYWSGLPFPYPEDLPDPGTEPGSPALQADSLPSELQGRCYRENICQIQSDGFFCQGGRVGLHFYDVVFVGLLVGSRDRVCVCVCVCACCFHQ